MHELSIAIDMIEASEQKLHEAGGTRITRFFVRLGALSGVVPDALCFAFEVASQGTVAEGAGLEIETVPVVVFCPECGRGWEPGSPLSMNCPTCGRASRDVRSGREFDLSALEIV